jgi:hypothetical protein
MLEDVTPYKQSQYSREDYKLLGKMYPNWQATLIRANYRDKRFRRGRSPETSEVLHCPLEDVPLYLNHESTRVIELAQWRLTISK